MAHWQPAQLAGVPHRCGRPHGRLHRIVTIIIITTAGAVHSCACGKQARRPWAPPLCTPLQRMASSSFSALRSLRPNEPPPLPLLLERRLPPEVEEAASLAPLLLLLPPSLLMEERREPPASELLPLPVAPPPGAECVCSDSSSSSLAHSLPPAELSRRAADTLAQCTAASYAPAPCSVSSEPAHAPTEKRE